MIELGHVRKWPLLMFLKDWASTVVSRCTEAGEGKARFVNHSTPLLVLEHLHCIWSRGTHDDRGPSWPSAPFGVVGDLALAPQPDRPRSCDPCLLHFGGPSLLTFL